MHFNNNRADSVETEPPSDAETRPNDAALKTEFSFYYTAPTRFLEDASNKKTRNFAKDSENRRLRSARRPPIRAQLFKRFSIFSKAVVLTP
ncbi:MAG: hypothetical protein IJY15_09125, partial [Thermoguttaceae bacterium]|nr:hypothetical protein [Thermoguttaceae bacterium]